MVDPFLPDAEKVAAVREMLPATGAGIYLDAATAGPIPAETARALQESDDWELRVGRGGMDRDVDLEQRDAEARAVLAALIGADPDDLVMTHGHWDGIHRLASLGEERVILQGVGRLDGQMRQPDRRSAGAGHLVFDASLWVGAVPLAATELDVDAIVFDGHRWLLGPEGTGAIWLGPGVRERRRAIEGTGDDLGRREVLGLARSVGWLEMYVGLSWIHERTRTLAHLLHESLSAIPGVTVGPARDELAAIVVFGIAGWDAEMAAEELSHRVQAIVGVIPPRMRRRILASVGFWNTEEELERFTQAVGELARHTPDSLPRRPSLVVLPSTADDAHR